jgi:hypothetical protein
MEELLARRDELITLLRAEGNGGTSEDMPPEDKPATTTTDDPPAYIARCRWCGRSQWGPIADPVPEVLPSGRRVMTEIWGCRPCHDTAAKP